ncbi:MAG: hypothetical protein M1381_08420 [Deltaproteobacteria bacterium]|nr:hypothetical protein [Deltaproteobacteria bacterium]MCL5792321.1 hypothetical protein [Deltaproteobacteria bacterium]
MKGDKLPKSSKENIYMNELPFSEVEKEVILLKAIQELIDSMVNYEILDLAGNDPHSNIMFISPTHQKLFNIIFVDFLSCPDEKITGRQQSYLSAIKKICDKPSFNENNSINDLKSVVGEFTSWLEREVKVPVWLPSIEKEFILSIKRFDVLKICGNISKHNFTRLSGIVEKLTMIFQSNKLCNIDFEDTLLSLNVFYDRFHTDILNYHSSTIAEFLNNIRWGIYEYLKPEFSRSAILKDGKPPKYTFPKGINNKFPQNAYWELMNEVRERPYMRKFKVSRYLKLNY